MIDYRSIATTLQGWMATMYKCVMSRSSTKTINGVKVTVSPSGALSVNPDDVIKSVRKGS